MLKTRAVSRSFTYSSLRPIRSIRRAILACKPKLIVPCDDIAVRHLHALHALTSDPLTSTAADQELSELIETSLGAPDCYSIAASRLQLVQVAQELGLRTPDTALVDSVHDLHRFGLRQPFPWVLKVDGTWGGHGVKIVHSLSEAEQALSQMRRPLTLASAVKRLLVNRDPYWLLPYWQQSQPVVTVQSFIRGTPANSAIATLNGRVLAASSVKVIAALSQTGASSVVRVVENETMLHASEQLAARLKLSGFHGFDFMIEDRTGNAHVIELNPRCTPLSPLQLGPGRDLVGALCSALTGERRRPRPLTTTHQQIAYFPQAWRWNPGSELLQTGYHDVPWTEPALVEDLIKTPWPDRSRLARVSDHFRNLSIEQRVAKSVQYSGDAAQPSAARAS